MALRSHLLAAARFGPYTQSELALARELWPLIPDDSLAIVDRAFFDAKILIPLARDGHNRHWLLRAKSTSSCRTIRKLGRGEELVEFTTSSFARDADPSLPATYIARAIAYQRPGFPPQRLFTSLLDAKQYPAREVIALYHERRSASPRSSGQSDSRTTWCASRWSVSPKRPACLRPASAS